MWIDFFWKANFAISLLVIALLLSAHMPKKRYYWVKWCFFIIVQIGLSLLIFGNWEVERVILLRELIIDKIATYLIGGMVILQIRMTNEVRFGDALYIFVTAYCLQKMDFSVYMIVDNSLALIGAPHSNPFNNVLMYLIVLSVFCIIIYIFLLRFIDDRGYLNFEKRKTTLIALFILFLEDVIDGYMFISDASYHVGGTLIVSRIYSIFFNIVMLAMLFNLIGKKQLQTENNVLENMLGKRDEQYQFSKDLIDSINVKSHDMKKQLSYLKGNSAIHATSIEEIESSVQAYETVVNTDHATLSTILTEKSVACRKHNIPFSCIADGRTIDFMKELDIYTLFANLLDNAIEASLKLPIEGRSISLIVKTQNQFLSIREENYYAGELKVQDGQLLTTKDDGMNHGFGSKSMKMIIEKYEGSMTMKMKDGTFQLNILIPIP